MTIKTTPSSTLSLARGRHVLLAVAAAGIGFQLVHFAEHLLQVAHWVLHPTSHPWLTPWAAAGVDGLAALTDGRHSTGMELLHLLGNAIFLAGLVATLALLGRSRTPRRLVVTSWLQAAHLAEHVVLAATAMLAGEAIGVTTAFGAVAAGSPGAVALRVWAHFALNLVVTVYALRGLRDVPLSSSIITSAPSSR